MIRSTFILLICMLSLSISAQQKHPESYICYRVDAPITVDGKLTNAEWDKAQWTNYFVDIEGDIRPKPTYNTRAKMLWDDEYMYFAAEMEELHIWAKLTDRDAVIFYDNDFEIFIDPQGDNHLYYEFEMNALNTVWDLLLIKPYRDGAPAVDSWDIQGLQSGVEIFGTLNNPSDTDDKWTVEVAIPWKVLEEAAHHNGMPKHGEQWRVNFSRVNWDMEYADGSYTKSKNPATGKPYPEHNWVWSPQGVIAMHRPETWGYVQFSANTVGTNTDSFIKDFDYQFKKELISLYDKMKKYKAKNGHYTNKLKHLFSKSKNMSIETTSRQFLIYGIAPSGKKCFINQESKIWCEETKQQSK